MDTGQDAIVFRDAFQRLRALCPDEHSDQRFVQVEARFEKILSVAGHYDYQDIKLNGYRVTIYILSKLASECVSYSPEKWSHFLRLVEFYTKIVLECFESSSQPNELEPLSSERFFELTAEWISMRDDLVIIGQFAGRHLAPESGRLYGLAPIVLLLFNSSGSFPAILKQLVNSDQRNRALAHMVTTMTPKLLKNLCNSTESWWATMGSTLLNWTAYRHILRQTIHVRSRCQFRLELMSDEHDVQIVREDGSKDTTDHVRCRLYYSSARRRSQRTKLIFHVHGGAYIGGSPDSHEVYLFEYASRLPDMAILSVDYGLAPETKFPHSLQQLLDVYDWATSGSLEVKRALGFCPSKVVLTGDSAGASMALALLYIMNDINGQEPQGGPCPLPLPSGLVSVYGALTASFAFYPSVVSSALDFVLTPYSFCSIIASYSPYAIELGENWIHATDQNAPLQAHLKFERHPYWSPLHYCPSKLDSLAGVKLSLVTTAACPFSDTNLILAKSWRGPVSFTLVDNEPHGFLMLSMVSSAARAATHKCIEQLIWCLEDD